jgi:hypothetical protein
MFNELNVHMLPSALSLNMPVMLVVCIPREYLDTFSIERKSGGDFSACERLNYTYLE